MIFSTLIVRLKHRAKVYSLFFMLVLGISAAALSTWQSVGPPGGDVRAIAFNPKNRADIYALAYSDNLGQVFRSTNSGQSWKRIASFDNCVYDLAINPLNQRIIYVLSKTGVFKSTNRGVSWSEYTFGKKYGSLDGELAIHWTNPSVIYASGYSITSGGKSCTAVFKSVDGGAHWKVKKFNATSKEGYALSVAIAPSSPNILYMSGYYSDGNIFHYKFYKSLNDGTSWTEIGNTIQEQVTSIAIDPTNPNKVYAGTEWAVYRSSDGGQTWQRNEGFAFAHALAIDGSNPNIIYAGYDKKCYKSTDGSVNWTEYTSGLSGSCRKLLVASNKVYFASSGGIFKSTDGGVNWAASQNGLGASIIPALALAPSSPNLIYTEVASNGFFRSTNAGSSWQRLPDFYRCESIFRITVHPTNANKLFIMVGG
jgi:photosystem II stability/assembly factor-like uncharacterized protein